MKTPHPADARAERSKTKSHNDLPTVPAPAPIDAAALAEAEWAPFPGGELEGPRPKALCARCRDRLNAGPGPATPARRPAPICFECYRTDVRRLRSLKAAGELNTASEARFQCTLPFEPVNRTRLEMLKVERATARGAMQSAPASYVDKRRHAQIEARHALDRIGAELAARGLSAALRDKAIAAAIHAAELQLPEAWLPFVVNR